MIALICVERRLRGDGRENFTPRESVEIYVSGRKVRKVLKTDKMMVYAVAEAKGLVVLPRATALHLKGRLGAVASTTWDLYPGRAIAQNNGRAKDTRFRSLTSPHINRSGIPGVVRSRNFNTASEPLRKPGGIYLSALQPRRVLRLHKSMTYAVSPTRTLILLAY